MRHRWTAIPQRLDAWSRSRPWLGDLLLAVALAALTGWSSAALLLDSDLGVGWGASLGGALVVLHGSVLIRRAVPVLAFGLAAGAELVLVAAPRLLLATDPAGSAFPATLLPSNVAYLVCAYSLSAYGRRPWPSVSLLVGVVGAALVTWRFVTAPGFSGTAPGGTLGGTLFVSGALLAAVTVAWCTGWFRRLRADQVAALAERARRAEDDREERVRQAAADERARIARELHDVVAHSLSVIVRQAEGGRYVARSDPAAAGPVLTTIADTGREALTDMRSLLGVLDSESSTPGAGPQPTVDDVPELLDRVRASGQSVTLEISGQPLPLDRAAHLAAYRLVQEALTNVVKHAGPAAHAEVLLAWQPDRLRLTVTDDGLAPLATAGIRPDGRGLLGMRERLHLVGGRLTAGPASSGGYSVEGEIPAGAGARSP